jgi:hypothetical protein
MLYLVVSNNCIEILKGLEKHHLAKVEHAGNCKVHEALILQSVEVEQFRVCRFLMALLNLSTNTTNPEPAPVR